MWGNLHLVDWALAASELRGELLESFSHLGDSGL